MASFNATPWLLIPTASARVCDHQAADEDLDELTLRQAKARSHGALYAPHQHRRNLNIMDSQTHFCNERDNFDVEEERSGEVLMFHGLILRSQLVEMLKNKVFYSESDGVSEPITCSA